MVISSLPYRTLTAPRIRRLRAPAETALTGAEDSSAHTEIKVPAFKVTWVSTDSSAHTEIKDQGRKQGAEEERTAPRIRRLRVKYGFDFPRR